MGSGRPIEIITERELPPCRDEGSPGQVGWLESLGASCEALAKGHRPASRRHAGVASPRKQSEVQRHLWMPPTTVAELVDIAVATGLRQNTLEFVGPQLEDADGGVRRVATTLRVARFLSPFPTWLTVVPWWRGRSLLTLSLRRPRRRHYPMRYFDVGHAALDELVVELDLAIRPSASWVRLPVPR